MDERPWLYAWGLGSVALGTASLLVPLYLVSLGASPLHLGLLGAAAAFIGAPGAILWGRLADRTANRRAAVLFSLVGAAIVLAATPFLRSIPALIGANALLWFVVAAAGPVLTLLVVADAPEDEWGREIAQLNRYQGYGWAFGLLLGIVWTAAAGRVLSPVRAQQSLFLVCALVAGVAAILLSGWMPSPTERQLDRVDPRRVARLLSQRRRGVKGATFVFAPRQLYWATRSIDLRRFADRFSPTLATYFGGVALFFTGFAAFFAPLPLFLTDAGFSADLTFGFYLISSLGSAVFYTGAGKLSGEYDLRVLQTGALGVRGIVMPSVAVTGAALAASPLGVGLVGIEFALIGVSWALIAVTGGTIVTRLAPTSLRGEALGVYAALSTLAGGVGSVAGGSIAGAFGYLPAFGVAGVAVVAGATLVVSLRGISTGTRSPSGIEPEGQ